MSKSGCGPTAVLDAAAETCGPRARAERVVRELPYSVEVEIEGAAHLLCHRYGRFSIRRFEVRSFCPEFDTRSPEISRSSCDAT